jgi:NitT/TauT family transport system permease protein
VPAQTLVGSTASQSHPSQTESHEVEAKADGRGSLSLVFLLGRVILVGAFLALWEASPRIGLVHPIVVAPPSAILAAAAIDWPVFLGALRVTVLEALVTIVISWTAGIGLGVVMGSSARIARYVVPSLESAFAMPWVVLYPLLVLWMGIGSPSKVAYASIAAIFPILLTTIAAVATVEGHCVLLGRALGASRLQMYTKVLLPFALPRVLAGLRLGTAVAVIAVITSEMLASLAGLGFVITYNRTQFETGHVYLGLVLAISLAQGANWLFNWAERRFGWWAAVEG